MRFNKYRVIVFFLLLVGTVAYSQEKRSEIFVDFRVNSTQIETAYRNNSTRIEEILSFLRRIEADSTLSIVNIAFCGSASPEGSYEQNKHLAKSRMEALEKLVRSKVEIPDSLISRDDSYIPWELLTTQVKESDIRHKEEILSILAEKPRIVDYHSGRSIDSRIPKLQKLNGGTVWREMLRRFFVPMRNACVVFVTYKQVTPPAETPEPVVVEETPAEPAPAPVVVVEKQDTAIAEQPAQPVLQRFPVAFKTNLLEDAFAIPNIGIEIALGKQWSIGANWMYAWWKSDRRHRYWRVYGGDIYARKYFGKKAKVRNFTGHHLGIYGQALTYDFEWGGRGYMGGIPGGNIFDKMNYGAGIEYGYSLPVAKRLNFDFSLGVGYLGGEYREYKPIDEHYVWQYTKNRNWFGPTKAEISLVLLLGKIEKGGKR